ncbi:unnamed protein product [Urochloa decumbens]|uniref:Uncharacterized protein n=1 Tax=Urochloa decumbens TaxID=240449 RepID=A0ABC9E1V9_9POAL
MAEVLATMVVGPLVSMVKDKASSYVLDQYKVMEGMEEQHKLLKRKLPAILDVITDAEEQAAARREGAKAWLEEVEKVAYQANDVLDEFKYKALRRKAKEEGHYKELGMDVIKLFPSHNRIVFRYRMGNKLRMILQEIDVLIVEMNAFRFKFKPQPAMSMKWRETDSNISNPSVNIESRAKEKQEVVSILVNHASNVDLTVLPIVGMGGLGKTTLAQLVYNDHDIQKHFKLLLWVCVSDNFDVDSLAERIVEEADAKNGFKANGNSTLEKLQRAVIGKRYLLILDDVWNREVKPWEKLKSYLQHGGSGSCVLTTTRDEIVAQLMGTTKVYHLQSLDESFIMEIIETRAFSSEKERPAELVEIVGDITKRCAGSPLAATALGSALRTKTTVDEWKAVLSRSIICDEENEILPILKLSYNCLPSYMRQCFAFCAVFPKDHEIDVEMLIQLWMANGFIMEQQGVCPEIVGKKFFYQLASRSFFQDVKGVPFEFHHKKVSVSTCKIHDLMHDVAQSAMRNECATIATEQSPTKDFPYSARHLFLSVEEPETILNGSEDKGSPVIQTLICDRFLKEDLQHLSKYRSLRALKIRRGSFLKPKYLHHLRYLDLSESDIEALPEDISILYHLQTLNLSGCSNLDRLPKNIKYMTALRHLYTHKCPRLNSMPPDLGHLTSLQVLTCFVVGACSGCSNVGELQQLDLGGQLELRKLENVKEGDAKAANLGNKKKLTELTLKWTNGDNEAQNNHKEVLEGLKPHEGLKVLRIHSCWSSTCSLWINKLQCMVELELSDCENIEKLPPLWLLPALQVLQLSGLECLDCLFSGDTPLTFHTLKELSLSSMPNFETWWDINEIQVEEEEPIFPQVEMLSISDCESLSALPKASLISGSSGGRFYTVCRSAFPALKELELEGLMSFERWEAVQGIRGEQVTFPQLEKLTIEDCPELTTLPEAPKLSAVEINEGNQLISLQAAWRYIASLSSLRLGLSTDDTEAPMMDEENSIELVHDNEKWNHISPLAVMELNGCNLLFSHPSAPAIWTCFAQLLNLEIQRCETLVYWPDKVFQCLVSLRTLTISECNKLTGHIQASEHSALKRSQLLPHLESLVIFDCGSFVEVPHLPASLKILRIEICPKLESIMFNLQQSGTAKTDVVRQENRSEATASTAILDDRFLTCLESLTILDCEGLSEVANLPPSIKTFVIHNCSNLQSLSGHLDSVQILNIWGCGSLKSLESCFGEHPSLEELRLYYCGSLVSLPNGPRAYSSLKVLKVEACSGINLLPPSLQQRLDYLEEKELDACYEGERYYKEAFSLARKTSSRTQAEEFDR